MGPRSAGEGANATSVSSRARADVCRRRCGQDGDDRVLQNGGPEPALDFLFRQLFPFQVLDDQFVVPFRCGLYDSYACSLSLVLQVGGDFVYFPLGPQVGLHFHQVHHAHKVGLGADGELQGDEVLPAERIPQRLERAGEVGVLPVHLVDHDHPGQLLLLRVGPDQFGTDLHPADGVYQDECQVRDPDSADDLPDEVQITGGIQDVQFTASPLYRDEGEA